MDFSHLYAPLSSMTPWGGGLSTSPEPQSPFCSCYHHGWELEDGQSFVSVKSDTASSKGVKCKDGSQDVNATDAASDMDDSDSNKENEDPAKGQANDPPSGNTSNRDSAVVLGCDKETHGDVDKASEGTSTPRLSLVDVLIREYSVHFAAHQLD